METSTKFFNCSNYLFNSSYSSSDSTACVCSQSRFLNDESKVKPRTRSFVLNPKCEILGPKGSNPSSSSSSHSALKILKTSAADRYTKENSSLVVIGINVHSTPLEVREKLSIPEAQWPQAISELCELNHIDEAAVLSTCNRMEVYVVALSKHRGVKEVTEWMSKISGVPTSELCQHRVLLYNKDAARHLFEVSAGLDSLVLGECQILAQVRQVVNTGKGVPSFNHMLNKLFNDAIRAGKCVRTETSIAAGSVSVSSASVELAKMKLPECSYATARVLVVGAGEMGKLVIKHLAAKGCSKMTVVNRTKDKVGAIDDELKNVEINYRPLSEMLASVAEADVVFTCTSADTPLFFKEHVQALPPIDNPKNGGTRLFIDISVPRNVGSCVSDLENARVYNVDDLNEVVAANKEVRLQKAMEAQTLIEEEVMKFESWKDSLETKPTIKKLRAYVDRIRSSEVEKCLSEMGDLPESTQTAIHHLTEDIMNKLLDGPMAAETTGLLRRFLKTCMPSIECLILIRRLRFRKKRYGASWTRMTSKVISCSSNILRSKMIRV